MRTFLQRARGPAIIPFIEGDGIGIDVTPAMQRVVDAAVATAYGGGAPHPLDGGLRGREGQPALWPVVPG